MMRLCRSRKYTYLLFLLSMNHTDWHRLCSDSRWVFLFKNEKSDDPVLVRKMLLHQVIHTFNLFHYALVKELWLELVDQERLQYDEKEVLSLWEKVQSELPFLQAQNPGFTDYTSLSNGTEHKLMM